MSLPKLHFLLLSLTSLIHSLTSEITLVNNGSIIQEISSFYYPDQSGILEFSSIQINKSNITSYLILISNDFVISNPELQGMMDIKILGNLLIEKARDEDQKDFYSQKIEPRDKQPINPSSLVEVTKDKSVKIEKKGLYHLLFITQSLEAFTLKINYSQYYKDKKGLNRYLSSEITSSIKYKYISFLIYSIALVFIVNIYSEPLKNPSQERGISIVNKLQTVSKIHYVILVLIFVKAIFCLSEGVYLAHLNNNGRNDYTFGIYLILGFLKTSIFLSSLILLGSGWHFLKPFLTKNEKLTLYVVLSMQTVFFWFYLLEEKNYFSLESKMLSMVARYLLEMISIVISYTPIEATINRLKKSASIDGKAAANVSRIKQLKKFYFIIVFCYYGGEMSKWVLLCFITPEMTPVYYFFEFAIDLFLYFAIVTIFRPKKFKIERRKLDIEDLEELEDGEFAVKDNRVSDV